eukprot:6182897-Pleurochrysis_carterae.AAC.1
MSWRDWLSISQLKPCVPCYPATPSGLLQERSLYVQNLPLSTVHCVVLAWHWPLRTDEIYLKSCSDTSYEAACNSLMALASAFWQLSVLKDWNYGRRWSILNTRLSGFDF